MPNEDTQAADQQQSQEDNTSENGQDLNPETLLAQKNHWKSKAIDPETGKPYKELLEAERQSKQPPKPEANSSSQTNNPSPAPVADPDRLDRMELRTMGHSEEEINAIMDLGGIKALNNPIVKEAVQNLRKKAKSADATPSDTAKSPVYKNHSEAELRAMPSAELEKILPHAD